MSPQNRPRVSGASGAAPAPVESVDRALRLLLFMRAHGSVSVKEAAEHLETAPSTAHRLLSTLTLRGFATQDFERRYRPGPVFSTGASLPVGDLKLREVGHAALLELQPKVNETVQLMVLRGGKIRFIDGAEPDTVLRVTMRIGDEMPAFVSAGGKAMLARLSNQDIELLYPAGLTEWPSRKVHTMQMLKRMMTKVRREGYGVSIEETEPGITGVGVSVNAPGGSAVAAVTTATPSVRFQRALLPLHVEALIHAARRIEDGLYREGSAFRS